MIDHGHQARNQLKDTNMNVGKLIFGLVILLFSYSRAENETNVDSKLDVVISAVGNLYENVKLASIVPYLLNNTNEPDQYLTTAELLTKYGYPVEIHTVTTADGYILEFHRIPYSAKSPAAENKPIAFLQHGLLSSSADWIILGPEKALGYLLADAGYDVWMGNARGNTYSKKHIILSPSDSKFWDFSWHEMGVYDLPAVLDYILTNTSQKDLYYIGHSMGTTMFFVLTSSMPQYNSKIRLMTSLAPIAYMGHATSPIPKFLSFNPLTYITVDLLGMKQFLPSGKLMTSIANIMCSDESIIQQVCSIVLFALCGYDADQLNVTMLPVFLSHTPAGSSVKSLLHYGQEMASGHFRRYDNGLIGNKINYGSFSPPDYDLGAVNAPVHLVYGDNDWFGDPDDVFALNKSLPNSVSMYRVPLNSFNHLDFLWATDVKTLVYDEIMKLMKEY